jgi:mannose-6-phosphate isomerase-like protein (cupin superfamily)
MPPEVYPAGPLTAQPDRPHSHAFIAPGPTGWTQVALMEWELTAESWSDEHPHDEYNYVLDGVLLVTCDGQTVEVPAGSAVRVPAGTTGHYAAPVHARMLAIYGPNPQGRPTSVHGLSRLTGGGTRPGPVVEPSEG